MADSSPPADPRLMVVLAHPALERSRANRAMAVAAECLPGATLHDLYESYPNFLIDVPAEQERLLAHDTIVLQFPLYWYSAPSLLKEWIDLVWLHGFAYGLEGRALEGKTLACACSTGGSDEAYGPFGHNRYTIDEFLRPFEATAFLCGMRWVPPFVTHGAALLNDEDLKRSSKEYFHWLQALAPGERRSQAA
jgi:glutathione-regulated potassium-efflux system ancillary protein KefG